MAFVAIPAEVGALGLSTDDLGAVLSLYLLANQRRWEPFEASTSFLAIRFGRGWSTSRVHRLLKKLIAAGLVSIDVRGSRRASLMRVRKGVRTTDSAWDASWDAQRDAKRDATIPTPSALLLPLRNAQRDAPWDAPWEEEQEEQHKKNNKNPPTPQGGSPGDPLQELYAEWRMSVGMKAQDLTDKRRALLKRRVGSHGQEMVRKALQGLALDPWHRKNQKNRDFEYGLRCTINGDNIAKFADLFDTQSGGNALDGEWHEPSAELPEAQRLEAGSW